MPDPILARELEDALVAAGAIERRAFELGQGTLDDIMAEGFDAAVLAVGLSHSQALPGAVRPASGVCGALEFLRQVKHEGRKVEGTVLVVGGGNTAIDAALSARRAGATDVSIVYRRSFAEMPAWPEERDTAVAAGVNFLVLTQPVGYESADGQLTGLRVVRTKLGAPDASGRRRPENQPASEHVMEANLVVEAIGQGLAPELRGALQGVELTKNGLVAVRPGSLETARKNVYAAGDVVNGGATVVQAVAEGLRAARQVDEALCGSKLVTLG